MRMILILRKENKKRIINLKWYGQIKKLATNRGFLPETTPLKLFK